jgi:predicted nuclease of predicted toxin-antitoxin system
VKAVELPFLVDAGVGTQVEGYLREAGYDVRAVRAIDPRMPDEEIIRLAVSEGRMIVTMDKDFGELVYRGKQGHSGVLLLRMEDARGEEKAEAVAQILREFAGQIKGRFCVYQNERLRIRRKS